MIGNVGGLETGAEKTSNSQQETCQSTPLRQLRNDYLWVTDLVQQIWCEQQLVYKLTLPTVLVEEPAMTEGSNLHLARGMLTFLHKNVSTLLEQFNILHQN